MAEAITKAGTGIMGSNWLGAIVFGWVMGGATQ